MAKYHVGQFLRHPSARDKYEVLRCPETTVYNDVPSYMLRHITLGPKTPPFFRSQVDVESIWKEWSPMPDPKNPLYPIGTRLRHIKRGSVHEILGLPHEHRIESTWLPAYYYTCGDVKTLREQAEMEDGRFEVINV